MTLVQLSFSARSPQPANPPNVTGDKGHRCCKLPTSVQEGLPRSRCGGRPRAAARGCRQHQSFRSHIQKATAAAACVGEQCRSQLHVRWGHSRWCATPDTGVLSAQVPITSCLQHRRFAISVPDTLLHFSRSLSSLPSNPHATLGKSCTTAGITFCMPIRSTTWVPTC